jgi:hypothetical protein
VLLIREAERSFARVAVVRLDVCTDSSDGVITVAGVLAVASRIQAVACHLIVIAGKFIVVRALLDGAAVAASSSIPAAHVGAEVRVIQAILAGELTAAES